MDLIRHSSTKRVATKRMEVPFSLQGSSWSRPEVTGTSCTRRAGELSSQHKKEFFSVRTLIHWEKTPKDLVKSLLSEVFKMQLGRMPGHVIQAHSPTKGGPDGLLRS